MDPIAARPGVLVVSGLDPSGGAGLIADVRVAERLGARPCGVVAVHTVQDTTGVRGVVPAAPELVSEQLTALLSDVEVRAVKIGALGTAQVAETVAAALCQTAAPVVWDPVGAPTAGRSPLSVDIAACAAALAPHLTVVTPNLAEAAVLAEPGTSPAAIADVDAMAAAGRRIAERLQCAALVTGGHLPDAVADVLVDAAGAATTLPGERVDTGGAVHGTGCALSTALACELAAGQTLAEAAARASAFVRARLAEVARPGRGLAAVL